MAIGQGSPSPRRADKGQIATCRAVLQLDLSSGAPTATVVGNREEPSGESRLRRQKELFFGDLIRHHYYITHERILDRLIEERAKLLAM
jgi:hypothetical protein